MATDSTTKLRGRIEQALSYLNEDNPDARAQAHNVLTGALRDPDVWDRSRPEESHLKDALADLAHFRDASAQSTIWSPHADASELASRVDRVLDAAGFTLKEGE